MNPTIAEVVEKLQSLGSGDQIALFFDEQGIKGVTGSPSWCAVSVYVERETGQKVMTCGTGVLLQSDLPQPGESVMSKAQALIEKDSPVRQFLSAFDKRHYPDLISEDDK